MNNTEIKKAIPGVGITLTIAMIAYLTSTLHDSFDPLAISIIFGMLVANMLEERGAIENGIDLCLKIFLPLGIGLYGIQLRLVGIDVRFWPAVATVFIMLFGITYLVARGFGISRVLAYLISTGMSVCGASAIIVIAPILNAEKRDTSLSILCVMTVGLTGMVFYRFLPDVMGLTLERFAFLSGTTLPMFGQVKVAAVSLGDESLALASNFKLLRISTLLVVAAIAMVFPDSGQRRMRFPWFMAVFFFLALLANLSDTAASLRGFVEPISKFSLSAALAAIGLSLRFDSITERGASPLFSCFLSWGIVVLTIYLLFSVIA